MIDTNILHTKIAASAPDYLRELFGAEVKPAGTDRWRVGRHGSLAIRIRDSRLLFYSHEEGAGGDAIALWQRQRGGSPGEALKAAAAWGNIADDGAPARKARRRSRAPRPDRRTAHLPPPPPPTRPPVAEPEPPTTPPPRMTDAEFDEAFGMIRRLAGDEALCARIAKARGWKTETIRGLTGDGALGWSDGWRGRHQGALAFCYHSGIKLRWRRGEERMIRWYRGKPATLWREWMILDQKEIWITEGETDAITMINGGLEDSLEVLVTALPNAGAVPHGLAALVAGRRVVLSLDADKAGQAASKKIAAIIEPVASRLEIWTGL